MSFSQAADYDAKTLLSHHYTHPSHPLSGSYYPTISAKTTALRGLGSGELSCIRSSSIVMRFSPTHAPDPSIAYTQSKLEAFLGPLNRREGSQTYMFAVEERERPGLLIGDLGVHDMHTDAREKGEERWGWRAGQAELGYLYREDRWGKG